jgi:transposase
MWTNENRGRYDRSRLRYPSDLTDQEWAHIEPLITACQTRRQQTARPHCVSFNIMADDIQFVIRARRKREVYVYAKLNNIGQRIGRNAGFNSRVYKVFQAHKIQTSFSEDRHPRERQSSRACADVLRNFVGIQTALAVKRLYDGTPRFYWCDRMLSLVGLRVKRSRAGYRRTIPTAH